MPNDQLGLCKRFGSFAMQYSGGILAIRGRDVNCIMMRDASQLYFDCHTGGTERFQ